MIDHGMGDLQTVSALALKAGIHMDMVGEGFLTTLKKSYRKERSHKKKLMMRAGWSLKQNINWAYLMIPSGIVIHSDRRLKFIHQLI